MRLKLGFILCVLIIFAFPSSLLAQQQVAPQTKKNVVKNFKANLNDYSPFGSNCNLKPKGDANCDGKVNDFDLSVWEVEFNAAKSPKRSDFNNDGVVNLVDFGVWRNTVFPQKAASLTDKLSSLFTLSFQWKLESRQLVAWILDQVQDDNFFRMTVTAQEQQAKPIVVDAANSFLTASGNSSIISSLSGGNSQEVKFDPEGKPQSANFYDQNGLSVAAASFLESGSTVISTEDSGVQINITKTAAGPIIENFKNPDGSLLAIKTWPTQESYERRDPPLSVTIPGQGATKQILNIQPNGDGIVEKVDAVGNVLNRSQLRANGTLVTEDFQNRTITQSNSQVGLATLSMKNNIGGNSQYMFYQGGLYAVVQTDSGKKAYIAKPLNTEGNSWTLEILEDGIKREEKTITNPVTELKTGTPDPKQLVNMINYYKSASPSAEAVNFSDGFTSTAPGIRNPVQKANAILTISQAQAPAVLGIIKEAKAQQTSNWRETKNETVDNPKATDDPNGLFTTQTHTVVFENPRENSTPEVITVAITTPTGNGNRDDPGNIQANINGSAVTVPRDELPVNFQSAPTLDSLPTFLGNLRSTSDGASLPETPSSLIGAVSDPESPAAAPAPVPPGFNESRADAVDAAARAAGAKADSLDENATPTQRGIEARNEMSRSLNASDLFEPAEVAKYADTAFVTSFLSAQGNFELGDTASMTAARDDGRIQSAINALRDATGREPSISANELYNLDTTSQSQSGPTVTAREVAVTVAPALPERGASMSLEGGKFTSTITGYVDTNIRTTGLEGFASNIYDSAGNLVATQISSPTGRSDWTDQLTGETFTAQSGALTAATIDVSAPGSIVGISAADQTSLVAVGDASFINADGFIEGGRPATQEEYNAYQQQQAEQAESNPDATQISVSFEGTEPTATGGTTDPYVTEGYNWDDWGSVGTWNDPGGEPAGGNEGQPTGGDVGVSTEGGTGSNENFNNDPSTGGDANTSGADSSGWQ